MKTTTTPATGSQALFEAMFDHVPQVDTRTPADVKAAKDAGTL